ncbi:MAG: N-6 DNA methylase, partial [Candidatus Wallbacteria bacterium]|nr:N-6 DNA methylase [Candidatus Wallbacteria bacterium]
VMISIRSNFFYTRSVPCELWFFDRNKPENRRDKTLMLDCRNIFRKVTRKIFDFSPEQMQNISAIVWLYRGQHERFLQLMQRYLQKICIESAAVSDVVAPFNKMLTDMCGKYAVYAGSIKAVKTKHDKSGTWSEAHTELNEAVTLFQNDQNHLLRAIADFLKQYQSKVPGSNELQHRMRIKFDPIVEAGRGLIKQADLIYKLVSKVNDSISEISSDESMAVDYDRKAASKQIKQFDELRKSVVNQLKCLVYFHKQVVWLQDRFPKAELQDVAGLVKLVTRKDIEAADWSLTPGRYVGVAPQEEDENFDFEATMRDIHNELKELNTESMKLAEKIQKNFEELGI